MIKLTTALTLGILLVLVTGSAGHAGSPPLPASFYGTVTLDGLDVPAGTLVSAWINGVKYAEAPTTLADGQSVYLIDVPGDDPDTPQREGGRDGESVVFQVAGFDATPTTLWFGGTHHELNLQVITSPDLVVTEVSLEDIITDPQTLVAGGTVKASIANQGNVGVPSDTAFAVTFFEDRNGNARYDPAADNTLGQATHATGLDPDAEAAAAAVASQVLFRDNLVYALVDSGGGGAVAELDESNNLNHSGMTCQAWPPPGEINPVLEWEWISSPLEIDSDQVLMTPAVVDLTADGTPDVVFITSEGASPYDGVLRAIDGRDGSEIFAVTDQSHRLHTSSHVAVGDIDLDGRPEILAQHEPTGTGGGTIDAFEHDGTFKWRSLPATGNPAIADSDRDGVPEIVVGDRVLNNDGRLCWIGGYGRGERLDSWGRSWGALSLVADLDLAGNTAYRSDGSLYWHRDDLTDGWNAIGDFDGGGAPEVVLVTAPTAYTPGRVYLLERDGAAEIVFADSEMVRIYQRQRRQHSAPGGNGQLAALQQLPRQHPDRRPALPRRARPDRLLHPRGRGELPHLRRFHRADWQQRRHGCAGRLARGLLQ